MRDDETGVTYRRVVVDDESDASATRDRGRAVLQVLDELLVSHPEWPAPCVVDGRVVTDGNPVAEWLYRSPSLTEWRRDLVPSAKALYPVQRWGQGLPSGAPRDDVLQMVLGDSLDAVGIRTRARVLAAVLAARPPAAAPTAARPLWVSLACGAAVPVLDARAHSRRDAVLALVDIDAEALAFAGELAGQHGLVAGVDYWSLQRDLVRSLVVNDHLVTELGEGEAEVVEALGIFEYFSDASAVRLLRNAYRLLRVDGVLVVGNMLADRPQLAFNQRGAGWPALHVRSPEQLVDLVRRAGLPLDRTTLTTAQDGVYAVVSIER